MVALKGGLIVDIPIKDAIKEQRVVQKDSQLIRSAKLVGTCFGQPPGALD